MALRHKVIPVTLFEQNCTLVWCDQTLDAALIDPGGSVDKLLAEVRAQGLNLKQILLTHAHIDHAGGVAELLQNESVPVIGPHQADGFWINAMEQQSQMLGLPPSEPFSVTRWLDQGDTVSIGQETLSVIHCPGHSPGQIAFWHEPSRWVQVGDALFMGSIGRTDLPGGDYATAIRTVREKLFPLGDDVTFQPGHGPASTLGQERLTNPLFKDARSL